MLGLATSPILVRLCATLSSSYPFAAFNLTSIWTTILVVYLYFSICETMALVQLVQHVLDGMTFYLS